MPIVQPRQQRHAIREEGSSLAFTIPSRKQYFTIFFLGFWLIFWVIGELAALGVVFGFIVQLVFGRPDFLQEIGNGGLAGWLGVGIFMLVWLIGWTIAGGHALYTFFWQLAGKENFEVNYETIKIKNAVFGIGRTKEYLATQIKDLRVSPSYIDNNPFGRLRANSIWGRPAGHLVFDYGAETYRFGGGIDEAEAKQILEKIVARFPRYRTRSVETG